MLKHSFTVNASRYASDSQGIKTSVETMTVYLVPNSNFYLGDFADAPRQVQEPNLL
jgi:hypothetical protein